MKNLLNSVVTHIIFGTGKIVNQTNTTISVQFEDRTIEMQYPLAFEKYLVFEDKDLQSDVRKDLQKAIKERTEKEKKKSESTKQLLDRIELEKKNHISKIDKTNLVQAFEDIFDLFEDNDTLRPAIKTITENQMIIPETEELNTESPVSETEELNLEPPVHKTEVVISDKTAIQAASGYKNKKVCILNYASPVSPREKAKSGEISREASLCRTTTLYKSLVNKTCWENYYKPHIEEANPLNNNDIIYTPEVIVFKNDLDISNLLPEEDWFTVDILTCSVPKLIKKDKSIFIYKPDQSSISKKELINILNTRFKRIFEAAHQQNAKVLILGSIDCGKNHIPRELAAECFKETIDKYGTWFDTIEFAIPYISEKNPDLEVFREVFQEYQE